MTTEGRLRYIPALDGIRALAVAGVLVFHAGYDWASGGFLGVSTFFTLSGFLIATLLLREHEEHGRISLRRFWLARARRLMPALVMAFAGILLFAATVATSVQARSVADDGPWALFYMANWRFINEGQSYAELFSSDSTSPLIHLWSVAIEEQFYLVMPVVMLVLGRGDHFRRKLGIAATVGLAASLGSIAYLASNGADASRLYYGSDTRAPEILVGVVAAVWVDRHRDLLTRPAGRDVAAVGFVALGTMLLLWGVTTESTAWLHRGGFTLHAVLTMVVILAAAPPGPFARMLSVRPLRFVGRISYGIYLFHWPIYLWLTPDRIGFDGLGLLAVRVALSVCLAAFSYSIVEGPIRSGSFRFGPVPIGILAMMAALIATVPASAVPTEVVFEPIKSPEEVLAEQLGALDDRADPGLASAVVGDDVPPDELELRVTGALVGSALSGDAATDAAEAVLPIFEFDEDDAPRILLVGDSVMLTLGRGFEVDADAEGTYEVLNAGQIGCPVGRGGQQMVYDREVDFFEHCEHERWDPLIDAWQPDVVVLLSGVWDLKERRLDGWDEYLAPGDDEFDAWLLDEYRAAIERLGSGGAEVVLVRPACLHRVDQNGDAVDQDEFTPGRMEALWAGIIDPLSEQVTVLDLDELVCPGGEPTITWPTVEGEVRPDGVHFSEASSRIVAEVWSGQLLDLAYAQRGQGPG